jgi:hypothetical protein
MRLGHNRSRPFAQLHRAVEAGHPVTRAYGTQGAKLITGGEELDRAARVFDARGNVKGGRVDGLDEQARTELAALPAYGQEGWGRRQARAVLARAAQRAAAGQPESHAHNAPKRGGQGRSRRRSGRREAHVVGAGEASGWATQEAAAMKPKATGRRRKTTRRRAPVVLTRLSPRGKATQRVTSPKPVPLARGR